MTSAASVTLERPVAARWLIAVALSAALHGGLVWEASTMVWPRATWIEPVVPVDLSSPSPEPPRPEPPAREARPARRPPPARPPEPVASSAVPPAATLQKTEEPPRSTPTEPASATATAEPAASAPAALVLDPSASAPGATRGEVTAPATARDEPPPRPIVAATPPSAPSTPRITQAARPRGGYQVRPAYPETARRAGVQGTTVLRVRVEADGSIHEVQVQESAGHAALDQAAVEAVTRWRFDPARTGSDAVAVWVLIPVEFRIKSGF